MLLLACCGLMAASVGLCLNAYGVFYTPLAEALGVGRAAVTVHATISGILTGLLSPFAVKLAKKVPLRLLTAFGICLTCVSFLLMAAVKSLWLLNLCGVLRGIGNSCFYGPTITVILGNWFKKNQGTIVGLVLSFSGVAGAILSPILTACLERWGYQITSLLCAGIIAILALPLSMRTLTLEPWEAGEAAYGQDARQAEHKRAVQSRKVNKFTPMSPVFFSLAGMTFLSVAVTGLASHLSGIAESFQVGSETGALMISAAMLGNIASKFCSGVLSDKIGVYKAFTIMYLISLGGLVLLWFSRQSMMLLLASFLFGALYAACAVGQPMIVRQIYGDKQYTDAYAIISMIAVITPSLFISFVGWLYDIFGNYTAVFALFVAFEILALLLWNAAGLLAAGRNSVTD